MRTRSKAWIAAAALAPAILLAAGSETSTLVERWSPSEPTSAAFKKVTVVGIVADRALRHRFEDKLVSHLRGRGLMAVASYTLVEDLAVPGDPEEVLDRVLEQGIDGAVTVRAFPLTQPDEEAWGESWREGWPTDRILRAFVAESLPLSAKKADRYGLEFAVWYGSPAHAVWAGRTAVHSTSRLRKGAADIVQDVIDALEIAEIF